MPVDQSSLIIRRRLYTMTSNELSEVYQSLMNGQWGKDDFYNQELSITMDYWCQAVLAEVTARHL